MQRAIFSQQANAAAASLASRDDAFKVLLEDSSKPSNPLDELLSKALFPNIVKTSAQKTLPERAKQALYHRPTRRLFRLYRRLRIFFIPENVIVVGVENMENFRYISRQQKLFQDYFAGTPFEGESWPNFLQSLATELHS